MREVYAVATQKRIKTNKGRQQPMIKSGVDKQAMPARQVLIDAVNRGRVS